MVRLKSIANLLLISFVAVPLGAAIGVMDAVFGNILIKITNIRGFYPLCFLPFLFLIGMAIVFCYRRWGGESGKGMTLLLECATGDRRSIPLRLIPLVTVSTWLTHLFGGSAGREGVAVQIGGTAGHFLGSRIPLPNARKLLLVAGMAAGFAGLFRTPIAAVLFAMEVLCCGAMAWEALLPSLAAAFTAAWVSAQLGLEKFSVTLSDSVNLDFYTVLKLLALGIAFGLTGRLFAWLLQRCKSLAAEIRDPIRRIAFIGIGLSIVLLLLHNGRYSGLGINLIAAAFAGDTIYWYDWVLKILLTCATLAAGFQGGEVTPLFSIGASLGILLGCVLHLPILFCAALGYAAVFGSASNTCLAPIFIGCEVFGFSYAPYFFIVCAVAFAINGNRSIYAAQKTHIVLE